MNTRKVLGITGFLLIVAFGLLATIVGCVTPTGAPATQPSLIGVLGTTALITSPTAPPSTQPIVAVGQLAVKTIEEFIPVSTGIFTLIAGLAGLAAGAAGGTVAGSKVSTAQANTQTMTLKGAVSELATELVSPQTGVGWSKVTNDILVSVVGAAHPVVNNPVPTVAPNTDASAVAIPSVARV